MNRVVVIIVSLALLFACGDNNVVQKIDANYHIDNQNDTLTLSTNGKSYNLTFKLNNRLLLNPIANDTIDVLIEPTNQNKELFDKSSIELIEHRGNYCNILKIEKFHYKVIIDKSANGKAVTFGLKLRCKDYIIKEFYRDHYSDSITKIITYEYPSQPALVVYTFLVDEKPKFSDEFNE